MNKKNGFTLVEIIVVLVILAVLAAVTIPSMLGFVKSKDEYVCKSNRGALQRLYKAHSLTHKCAIDEFAKGSCDGLAADIKDLSCPMGGVFSSDDNLIILCSIHKNQSGGSGEEVPNIEKIPGTNIDLVESYWPTDEEVGGGINYDFKAGGVFKHTDGNYYVVIEDKTTWINKGQNDPNKFIVEDIVRKLSGTVISVDKNTTADIPSFSSSSICEVDGVYYVRKAGGNVYDTSPPHVNPSIWYKLP